MSLSLNNKDLLCQRCTNFIKELVASERSATATSATATTTTQSNDSQRSAASQQHSNAEAGDIEIQTEKTAGLGLHDEGGRERQDAQARQVQRSECALDREGEQGHGRSSRWSSNPLRSSSGAYGTVSSSLIESVLSLRREIVVERKTVPRGASPLPLLFFFVRSIEEMLPT